MTVFAEGRALHRVGEGGPGTGLRTQVRSRHMGNRKRQRLPAQRSGYAVRRQTWLAFKMTFLDGKDWEERGCKKDGAKSLWQKINLA